MFTNLEGIFKALFVFILEIVEQSVIDFKDSTQIIQIIPKRKKNVYLFFLQFQLKKSLAHE